jgi:hypothetical protein
LWEWLGGVLFRDGKFWQALTGSGIRLQAIEYKYFIHQKDEAAVPFWDKRPHTGSNQLY